MKKHIAKTISILSLFVMLSVAASNVSAFGTCGTCNSRSARYAATAPAQIANLTPAQDASPAPAQDTTAVDAQPVGDVSSIALFWARLAVFFAFLL